MFISINGYFTSIDISKRPAAKKSIIGCHNVIGVYVIRCSNIEQILNITYCMDCLLQVATFQAVLITNGVESYVMFNYGDIQFAKEAFDDGYAQVSRKPNHNRKMRYVHSWVYVSNSSLQ